MYYYFTFFHEVISSNPHSVLIVHIVQVVYDKVLTRLLLKQLWKSLSVLLFYKNLLFLALYFHQVPTILIHTSSYGFVPRFL